LFTLSSSFEKIKSKVNEMADIEKCKVEGFIAFHIQMSGHFTTQHPSLNYLENIEVVGNSDGDFKRFGFRPDIRYYRAKLAGEDVQPFDFEKGGRFEKRKLR
jgi:hypothetical protein